MLTVTGNSKGDILYGLVAEVEDPLLTVSPTGNSDYFEAPDSPEPQQPHDLGVGSVVEVTVCGEPRFGVIRWIGIVPADKKARQVAGIEMVGSLYFHYSSTCF
jgi:hypothetical protein